MNLPNSVLSYLTVRGATPAECIEAAATAGFEGVTLRVVPDGARPEDGPAEVGQLDTSHVRIAEVEYIDVRPGLDVARVLPLLDLAQRLGARSVTTICTDPDEGRATQALSSLSLAAGERGLRIALEFTAYTELDSLEQAYRMVRAVGSTTAFVAVDVLHLARSGASADDVTGLARAHAEAFPVIHLCDAPAGPEDASWQGLARESREDRRYPGDGALPLSDLIAALPEAWHFVEAPVRRMSGRSFAERAHAAATALHAVRRNARWSAPAI